MFLAIDTVTDVCSVALANAEGKLLASLGQRQERGHAEAIVPMIARALQKAKTSPDALQGIVVTIGPGSFAGVRIGLSAAQALGIATGAKVLGLTSFEAAMGLAVLRNGDKLPRFVLVALSGRGDERAAELFAPAQGKMPPWASRKGPKTLGPGEAERWLAGKSALIIGSAADGIARGLPGARVGGGLAWPRAEDLLRIKDFFPRARWGKRASPFYLRPPDARPSVIVPHG